MKKLSYILTTFLLVSGLAVSCVEQMPEVIEELELSNVLTPSTTTATVSTADGCTVTFSWNNSSGASQYLVEIYQIPQGESYSVADLTESVLAGLSCQTVTVEQSESGRRTSTSVELTPEYSYYARVCAQDPDSSKGDSKWAAFTYPIDTYTVMDAVASLEVTERQSNSITVSWTLAEGDEDGINQLRVSPHPTDASAAYLAVAVDTDASSATVEGLNPSVRYTIAAHLNSANRGTVYAWTRPDMSGATVVTDTAGFHQAVNDGAPEICVSFVDSTYVMGQMKITAASVKIYGQETVDGEKPEIVGQFQIADGVTDFRAEGLSFNGNAYGYQHLISFASAINTPINAIEVVNCDLTAFQRGLLYVSTGNKIASLGSLLFDGLYVSDIEGNGGEAVGFRGTTGETFGTIGSVTVTNSTFTDGMREFFRIDDSYSVGSFTFNNNTLNNLTTYGNSYGLFYIRAAVSSATFRNNVFLNMNNSSVVDNSGRYLWGASAFVPGTVSNNFWYNLVAAESAFPTSFTQSNATAGGGALLTADPCYDSARGVFNITNAAVLAASAGDPRWLAEYVPEPDPELVPVEYGYTWNLTDTYTFYDVIDQSCVRGNTRFIISSNPINVTADGFEFTAAPGFEYGGTPNDCAMAFLVDGPGSVVLSTVSAGNANDHVTVAYGPANGASATVAGSAYAGATRARVAFPDLVAGEQYLVYIYACGPIVLSELAWSDQTSTGGSSPLATPANVVISSADATEETVTLSWDAVPNAAAYRVYWDGPVPSVTDSTDVSVNSYDVTPTKFTTGIYNFTVKALKDDEDISHVDSEVSEPVKFISREALAPVSSGVPTTWGHDDFYFMQQLIGTNQNQNPADIWGDSFVYRGLEYYAANTIRFADSYGSVVFQYPGSSNNPPTRRYLRFLASGNGTLEVTLDATSAGRNVYVSVDGVSGEAHEAALNGTGGSAEGVGTFTEEITANAGSEIILWADASLRIYNITWTPSSYNAGGIPFDEEAINEAYLSDFSDKEVFPAETLYVATTIQKVTYLASESKPVYVDKSRIKLLGAPELDDNGVPQNRAVSFKVTMPGTVTHKLISSSSGDATRGHFLLLEVTRGTEKTYTTLYSGFAPTSSGADATTTEITSEHLAGATEAAVVYVYSDNNCNLYQIGFTPAQ